MLHKFSKSRLQIHVTQHVEGDVKHATGVVHPEVLISHEQLPFFEYVTFESIPLCRQT